MAAQQTVSSNKILCHWIELKTPPLAFFSWSLSPGEAESNPTPLFYAMQGVTMGAATV